LSAVAEKLPTSVRSLRAKSADDCPIFLYWISRALMLAHRRFMDDDPISFALKDNRTWAVGALPVFIVLAAS
jgi:hypothetical protein